MILMITGPSGCGKSSVAAAVAARCDGALVVQQDHYFAGEFTPYAGPPVSFYGGSDT